MTRVRFDPSFVEDERWERLGADALVLHIAAVSYSVRTLSDGVVSDSRVRVLTPLVRRPEAVARRLLEDGLWSRREDGAFVVCDARDDLRHSDGRGDEQPSRTFVEAERTRARERKEVWKKKNAEENAEKNGGRNGVPNASQSTANRPNAVQDPKGPSPAPPRRPGVATPPGLPTDCEHRVYRGLGCRECRLAREAV